MKHFSILLLILISSVLAQAQDPAATQVDQMPYFNSVNQLKAGSVEKRNESNRRIIEFVGASLVYPDSAKVNAIEGTVFLRFTINKAGKLVNPRLLYDIGFGCGEEALRIVNEMPDWEPALLNGQPVPVDLDLPVKFELVDDQVLAGYTLVWGDLDSDLVTKKKLIKLMEEPLKAFNEQGEEVDLLELKVAIVKNDQITRERLSDGRFNKKQKRLIKWLRRSQLLELVGTVQKEGKFYFIHRELKCTQCFSLHMLFF